MTIVHDSTAAVNDLAESLADSTAPRMGNAVKYFESVKTGVSQIGGI